MSSPRYLTSLVNGRIVITPASGQDATEEEVTWIKELITTSLRSKNFVNNKTGIGTYVEEDGTVEGSRFPVHPIIIELAKLQRAKGVTNGIIAGWMRVHPSTLPNYKYGKSRPHLDTLDVWAWTVDSKILLVPVALVSTIKQLITKQAEGTDSTSGE